MPRGLETGCWALYEAQALVDAGSDLKTLASCRRYIAEVMQGAWWQANAADVTRIDVATLPRKGEHQPAADATRMRTEDRAHHRVRFSTMPGARSRLVVLHEMAHCAEPKWRLMVDRAGRRRHPHTPEKLPEHGDAFAAAFLGLTREQLGEASATELERWFGTFGITPLDDPSLAEAVAMDRVASLWQAALQQEMREFEASRREPGAIPEVTWGDCIKYPSADIEVNGRRGVHPVTLARHVNRYVPCTREDLDAIFAARRCPDDPRLALIAFYLCVMAGIDTIWMQTALGLARWTVGDGTLELDDLEAVNPQWVATGRRLNAALEQARDTGRLE